MKKTLLLFALLLTTAFGYRVQAAESHTVACTAGNLATVAASYLTTVTNLTVTGTIDARDFKTMRDAMPLLAVIDLSGSTVAAYSGNEGTNRTTLTDYPANGIPDFAFHNPSSYMGKTSLNSFIYPSSVTRIGESAFDSCYDLRGSLTIPASVTTINSRAFYYCSNVTAIYVSTSTPIDISSSVDVFYGINKTTCTVYVPANSKVLYAAAAQWKDLNIVEDLSQSAVCTAGNLATVAASYLATVTNLTVTGTIDARDFKTMRDNMPLLSVIDLSGSTVVAYTGTEGTNWTNETSSIFYPANEIPSYAFRFASTWNGKTNLKSFIYPSSITSIGDDAFFNCSGLTGSLTIPQTVTTIGNGAFYSCIGLTGFLTLPSTATFIGGSAFEHCTGFTGTLIIPPSVTLIGSFAFYHCDGLTGSLTIPSSITAIYDYTFGNCVGLSGTLTIPESVKTIGNNAFFNCNGLTGSLTIPESVTTIGEWAFGLCSGLTGSITIPASVATIGPLAFVNSSGSFEVDDLNPNYSSLDGILYNKDKTTLIQCPISKSGDCPILSSVTTIGQWSFANCNRFTGSLTIPPSVTTIGSAAFYECSGFTGSLDIPSSVTTIGSYAFLKCSGFTGSLTIPSSVTAIGAVAFYSCSGLTSIYSMGTIPTDISSSDQVFYGVNKSIPLYVPADSKQLYEAANQWQDFTNIREMVPTSLNESEVSNTITLSPNPASSTITVSELSSLASDKAITLSITNILGNTLLTTSVEPTLNSATIDVSSLSSGAYVMVINSSNGNVVKRFLKR